MKYFSFSRILKVFKFVGKRIAFSLIIPVFLFFVYVFIGNYFFDRLEAGNKEVGRLLSVIHGISWMFLGSYIFVNFVSSFSKKKKSDLVAKLIVSVFVTLVIILLEVRVSNVYKMQAQLAASKLSTEINKKNMEITKQYEEEQTYYVEQGDNLWKIAEKHYGSGFTWIKLSIINELDNPRLIYPGQKLTIPYPWKAD
jgi:LysM repeat protein